MITNYRTFFCDIYSCVSRDTTINKSHTRIHIFLVSSKSEKSTWSSHQKTKKIFNLSHFITGKGLSHKHR
jgi:hypothetical protein